MTIQSFKTISTGCLKESAIILPIFFVAVVAGVLIDKFIPNQLFKQLIDRHLIIAIPLAALVGVIFPIPRYATYPIAFTLFLKGAGWGVVFALISGEVICESIARDVLEIKFFGFKFFSLRLVLSLGLIMLFGFVIEIIL